MANRESAHVRTSKERTWGRVVREWKSSGLSQAAFCRRKRIVLSTFRWWKRHLKRSRGEEKTAEFLPVKVVDTKPSCAQDACPIEIHLGRGRVVRLRRGFDSGDLEAVIRILEAASC
jgi:transposase